VISWFGSRVSSAKQTTKKHEHKTNPHEGRKAMSQVYYCPNLRFRVPPRLPLLRIMTPASFRWLSMAKASHR